MAPSTLQWVSNTTQEELYDPEGPYQQPGGILQTWNSRKYSVKIGPPKESDTYSNKQLLNMNLIGVYIESLNYEVPRTTNRFDQRPQTTASSSSSSSSSVSLDREEEAAKHFTDFAHTERTSVSVLLKGEGQLDYAARRRKVLRRFLLAINEHGAAGAEVGQQKQEQDGQPPAKRAKR